MYRRKILKFAMVSCLIALGACGGSSDANNPSTTLSEVMPSVTIDQASKTTLTGTDSISIDAAAQQYSSIVVKTNCAPMNYLAVEKKYSLGNGQVDLTNGLSDLTDAVLSTATQRDEAVRALISNEWPQKVQQDIEALALFWASLQRAEKGLSESTDLGTWNSNIQVYLSKSSSSESGLSKIIRIKLNLPDFSSSEC